LKPHRPTALAIASLLLSSVAFAAPSTPALPSVVATDAAGVMSAVRRPGARAVLVNIWATWCDPCVEELPDILKFYKESRQRGLRLVLVSADSRDDIEKVARFLGERGVEFTTYLKTGDDMAFIDGLDRRWDGTLPTSLLFDGSGQRQRLWQGPVTYDALKKELERVLNGGPEPAKNERPTKRRKP
jgi:thiol-disulfide isomerase/thioredoxin